MALALLPLAGAEVYFDSAWLPARDADALFAALLHEVPWETHRIRLFGREVESPRLSCWIGDPGTAYVYSRTRFEPQPWPPALAALRARIDAVAGQRMNSVLANRYRDGRDGMGWHADDEPELGPQPVIASLSLGATRRFVFRRRPRQGSAQRTAGESAPAEKFELELPHGSLLLMRGDTQRRWQHALPKTARAVGERINLTFRAIRPAA